MRVSLGHVLFLNSLLSFLTSSPSLVSTIVSVWHIFPSGLLLGTGGWQNVVWFCFLLCVGRNPKNRLKPGPWPVFLYCTPYSFTVQGHMRWVAQLAHLQAKQERSRKRSLLGQEIKFQVYQEVAEKLQPQRLIIYLRPRYATRKLRVFLFLVFFFRTTNVIPLCDEGTLSRQYDWRTKTDQVPFSSYPIPFYQAGLYKKQTIQIWTLIT